MSDWRETKESQEQDISPETTGEKLSPRGIGVMQGNLDNNRNGSLDFNQCQFVPGTVYGGRCPGYADKSSDGDGS